MLVITRVTPTVAGYCVADYANGTSDIFSVQRTRFGYQVRYVEPDYESPAKFGLTVKQAIRAINAHYLSWDVPPILEECTDLHCVCGTCGEPLFDVYPSDDWSLRF